MGSRLAVSGWIGTTVARSALVGHRHLRVIPLRGFPGTGAMAANAVDRGRYMLGQFTRCSAAVVTAGAIGSGRVQPMVWLCTDP
jgi:hypothetical protein